MCVKTDYYMLRTVVCLLWNHRWSVMSVEFKSWLLKVKFTTVLTHMYMNSVNYRVRVPLFYYKVHGKLTVWGVSEGNKKWVFNIIKLIIFEIRTFVKKSSFLGKFGSYSLMFSFWMRRCRCVSFSARIVLILSVGRI